MAKISNEYKIIDAYDKQSNHIWRTVRRNLLDTMDGKDDVEADGMEDDIAGEMEPVTNHIISEVEFKLDKQRK